MMVQMKFLSKMRTLHSNAFTTRSLKVLALSKSLSLKKTNTDETLDVGVRTKDGSAYSEARFDESEGKEVAASFDHLDQTITMMRKETERVVEITIHDNSDW